VTARKRPENHELFSPQQGYSIFLIVYIVYIYIYFVKDIVYNIVLKTLSCVIALFCGVTAIFYEGIYIRRI